jgi:hypothetical protein
MTAYDPADAEAARDVTALLNRPDTAAEASFVVTVPADALQAMTADQMAELVQAGRLAGVVAHTDRTLGTYTLAGLGTCPDLLRSKLPNTATIQQFT